MQTRRKFIQALSTSSIAVLGASPVGNAKEIQPAADQIQSHSISLADGWEFRLDPSGATIPDEPFNRGHEWEPVQIPHTWQSLGGTPDYVGIAWYRLRFHASKAWASQHVRIEFEAVNHTAHVLLNGEPIGEHVGKGYTAFALDLSAHLDFEHENTLLVRVDNRPNDRMLPRNKSYDWTDDGGIIRPVNLRITPQIFIERVEIDALPDLAAAKAEIRVRAIIRNTLPKPQRTELQAIVRREGSPDDLLRLGPLPATLGGDGDHVVELAPAMLEHPALWHFDSPQLYRAFFELKSSAGTHSVDERFGIRKFEIRESAFYLNGEKVSLIGVERMAGSHPELGFAETAEWIDSNHRDMKNLNCVFTRVHWEQDRRVLDFCDRNGILMQEEVPAWGPDTFSKTSDEVQEALEQNGLAQLREMIQRDRNHPCIVAWGLCNEVDGKNPRSRQFAKRIGAEARRLDPSRLQTYASHTLGSDPGADMAGEFDFISSNEYYGSWYPGTPADVEAHIGRIRKAFPGKPIVISEYGWCECQPKIMPGDQNRVGIVNSHTDALRKFPEVAGAIYFDYNDYRTLVGDKGSGAMRQRVHGVVDLYSNPKPSFEALRLQSSPIEHAAVRKIANGRYELEIRTRRHLPGYTLRGYSLRWIAHGYDDLPMTGERTLLPDLPPGSSGRYQVSLSADEIKRVVVDIVRSTEFSVLTVEYLDHAAET